MKIIWRDVDLQSHEIDLTSAVDVKIDGIKLCSLKQGVSISTDGAIKIMPIASNTVIVSEDN